MLKNIFRFRIYVNVCKQNAKRQIIVFIHSLLHFHNTISFQQLKTFEKTLKHRHTQTFIYYHHHPPNKISIIVLWNFSRVQKNTISSHQSHTIIQLKSPDYYLIITKKQNKQTIIKKKKNANNKRNRNLRHIIAKYLVIIEILHLKRYTILDYWLFTKVVLLS